MLSMGREGTTEAMRDPDVGFLGSFLSIIPNVLSGSHNPSERKGGSPAIIPVIFAVGVLALILLWLFMKFIPHDVIIFYVSLIVSVVIALGGLLMATRGIQNGIYIILLGIAMMIGTILFLSPDRTSVSFWSMIPFL